MFLCAAQVGRAQLFDRNLIVNPGAEAGPGLEEQTNPPLKEVPGWTIAGGFTVGQYGGVSLLEAPGYWPDRGRNYFFGGPNGKVRSTATQTIDLSAAAAEIDAGRVKFLLSSFLGGGGFSDTGSANIRAQFQNSAGATLVDSVINGPSRDESQTVAMLFVRATSGFLQPNVRKVVITVDLTDPRAGDISSSGADDISLVLVQNEPITGSNLVVNGGAEAGKGLGGCASTEASVPGWNASFNFSVVRYEDCEQTRTTPGPVDRGLNYFTPYNTSRAWQAVDVTLAKELIDGGGVVFKFGAWLGGSDDLTDQAAASVSFYSASNNLLGTTRLGPVTNTDRRNQTSLLERTADGPVPAGTRRIVVEMELTLESAIGEASTPAADNISLVLNSGAASVTITSIANAASLATGPVAPGEMVALHTTGVSLSAAVKMQLDSSGRLATELGGVKVFFDGTQAPLLNVSSSQVTAVAPFDLEGKSSAKIRIQYKGVESNTVTQPVSKTAPGIFSQEENGKGAGEIYNDGWVLNSKTNPAAPGSTVTIFWTGGGATFPAGTDGRIETRTAPRPSAEITVKIGGQPATVVFAGGVPFAWTGLLMAQVKVPAGLNGDALPVILTAGAASSADNSVTIAVKP